MITHRHIVGWFQPAVTPIVEEVREEDESKSTLKLFLDYYRTLENPGYAVLVIGAWGSGKTYQVKRAIKEDERFYVSLFGLQTAEEIYSAVYAAMFPMKHLAKRAAAGVKDVGADIGPMSFGIGSIASGLAGAFLKQQVDKSRVLIFDDLERCGLNLNDTLGVINTYVEHHECRVVVIAHDVKIENALSEVKEKVFGQTVKVEPQTDDAYTRFSSAFRTPEFGSFFDTFKAPILQAFYRADAGSLRVLKQTIEDVARLYECLSDVHRKHDDAMEVIIGQFAAFVVEVRAGNLKRGDIETRIDVQVEYGLDGEKKEKPRFVLCRDRHPTARFDNPIIDDQNLSAMLFDGRFDGEGIRRHLDSSNLFVDAANIPAWRVFLQIDYADEKDTDEAFPRLEDDFNQRRLVEPGEILHLFALRLTFASEGVIPASPAEIVEGCQRYIDDTLEANRLAPRGTEYHWTETYNSGHEGYAYWIPEDLKAEFTHLFRYLNAARVKAFEKTYPVLLPQLLDLMKTDGAKFSLLICTEYRGETHYALIPILAQIPPEAFVKIWLSSEQSNWMYVRHGLMRRYNTGELNRSLKDEGRWFLDVVKELEKEADAAVGLKRWRINRIIPRLKGMDMPRFEDDDAEPAPLLPDQTGD